MMILLDGKSLRDNILCELKEKLNKYHKQPCLAVILVGNDPASELYVKNKQKAADIVGIKTMLVRLESNVSQTEINTVIQKLNNDADINAILIQLPLPKHLNINEIIDLISPLKDVDCFTNENTGRLYANNLPIVYPCTPMGIIKLIEHYDIDLTGKNAVVIGRSNIVGRPIAHMLSQKNATVTLCHSKTKNLSDITKQADLLVVAVGKTIITKNDIKQDSIIINVGQHIENNKVCGDIDFEKVSQKASYITPIVGGTGPMTIACLMINVINLFEIQQK
ncbi:MAG: bifunctional 5,10-methylenetetrahydrofolate dehydrogenase/5,10-methenyltetrahydrofolate cyclohydrolase [Alphaproteobacteria bacterium]|nr:bifunctional 5,10-methylenetetrahydrofolate dehydrogenase/5,10-methenyltetrahydrofolate cyclohydrolase [Alphaproteobacteria bacterium]